jgi:hypothetical protein
MPRCVGLPPMGVDTPKQIHAIGCFGDEFCFLRLHSSELLAIAGPPSAMCTNGAEITEWTAPSTMDHAHSIVCTVLWLMTEL